MRRALLILAALAATGALTACGVSSTVDPVAAAATKTENAGGYHVEINSTVTSGGIELRMNGQGSFDRGEEELDVDVAEAYQSMNTPAGPDITMKTRYLNEGGDPVMYMNLGDLVGSLPNGKTWMRIDMEKAGKAMGVDFSQLMGGANQNPTQSLEMLKSSGEFTVVGTETVQGVETTHYHGTVDLQKAAQASGADSAAVQHLLDLGAPSQYPIDVWVDDAGLVRQYQTRLDEKVNGAATSVAMTVSMSDYGTTVDVSAPPAEQVFDATDAAAQGIQSQLDKAPSA
jgi:hypothetical protein